MAASVALVALAAGCAPSDARTAHEAPAAAAAAPALDRDSALAAFRAFLPRVDGFAHAAPARDSLVRAFVAALERADTAALARLHVSRAEYAWLIYPESRFARPPYRQPIDVAWLLIRERSSTGLARLLARRGGRPLRYDGHACSATPEHEGANRYHGECVVRHAADGVPVAERLFLSILEREGRWKIGSYANQF